MGSTTIINHKLLQYQKWILYIIITFFSKFNFQILAHYILYFGLAGPALSDDVVGLWRAWWSSWGWCRIVWDVVLEVLVGLMILNLAFWLRSALAVSALLVLQQLHIQVKNLNKINFFSCQNILRMRFTLFIEQAFLDSRWDRILHVYFVDWVNCVWATA